MSGTCLDSPPGRSLRAWLGEAKALVFDFDGTLVDSNPIKAEAFRSCFSDEPERLAEILAYCNGHPHIARDEKFRHVYRAILKRPYPPAVEQALLKRFEEATTQRVIEADEIPGASAFLKRVSRTHLTALLSATPDGVLKAILAARGWGLFFKRIQGAPVDKPLWLSELRRESGWGSGEVIFFGDSAEDSKAAQGADCRFVAVAPPGLLAGDFPVIRSFEEVP